jgi:hypothetical protein
MREVYIPENLTVHNITVANKLRLVGNGTDTNDLALTGLAGKLGINAKPDFDEALAAYQFPQNDATEKLFYSYQLSHAIKLNSIIRPHVHIRQASSGQSVWKFAYVISDPGKAISGTPTIYTMDSNIFTYTSGTISQIVQGSAGISIKGLGLSAMLIGALYREDNVITGDISMDFFDIHMELDGIGSNTEYTKE